MDAELNIRLKQELMLLNHNREQYRRRLELCRGFEDIRLKKATRRNGKSYYYEKQRKDSRYVYLGTKATPDVKKICEAHFIKEALRRIDHNIDLINSYLQDYLPYDMYAVNKALALTYRCDILPVSLAYQCEGEAWKNRRLAFQAQHPENYPEQKQKRHLMVLKSKR